MSTTNYLTRIAADLIRGEITSSRGQYHHIEKSEYCSLFEEDSFESIWVEFDEAKLKHVVSVLAAASKELSDSSVSSEVDFVGIQFLREGEVDDPTYHRIIRTSVNNNGVITINTESKWDENDFFEISVAL